MTCSCCSQQLPPPPPPPRFLKPPATAAAGSPADHGPLPGQGRVRESLQQQQQRQWRRTARALPWPWPFQHRQGLRVRGGPLARGAAGPYGAGVGVGRVGGGGGGAQDSGELLHRRWLPHVRRGEEIRYHHVGVLCQPRPLLILLQLWRARTALVPSRSQSACGEPVRTSR